MSRPGSEGACARDGVSTDNLERPQGLNVLHPPNGRLETHVRETAQLIQQRLSPRAVVARVHFEDYRLLDVVIVTALLTAVKAQDLELVAELVHRYDHGWRTTCVPI